MNGKYCTLHHQIGKAANKRHMDDVLQQVRGSQRQHGNLISDSRVSHQQQRRPSSVGNKKYSKKRPARNKRKHKRKKTKINHASKRGRDMKHCPHSVFLPFSHDDSKKGSKDYKSDRADKMVNSNNN